MRAGIAVADLAAGMLLAPIGILVALLERERSGEGQWVATSLLEALQIFMLDFQAARWLMKEVPRPGRQQPSDRHPDPASSAPRDGHINIASPAQEMWRRFCTALGRPTRIDDPDFATPKLRRKNRDKLNALIEEITATHERGRVDRDPEPRRRAVRADLPHRRGVRRPAGAASRHRAAGRAPTLGRIDLVGQPVKLSRTPSKLRRAAPERGEHTDEVLRELGYDAAAIAAPAPGGSRLNAMNA